MKYIIGVDIGTTSTKAIAYDLKGRALFKSEVGYKLLIPQIGMIEQDPDEIFKAVLISIKNITRQIDKNDMIIGISFSGAMHSVIPVDENGDKLMNAMIWTDTRSAQIAKDLRNSNEGFAIYERTGAPIHPMLPLCKIIWLRDSMKETFKKTSKLISIKEYIFHRLFGLYIIDHSMASGTGLFNLKNMKWDDIALKIAGISERVLSEIVPVNHILRGIKEPYASEIGLDPNVPVVIGGADGPLSNLGSSAIRKEISSISAGTSGAVRIVSNIPFIDPQMRTFTYVLDESHFTIGGSISNAGIALKWFVDDFSDKKMNALMAKASKIKPGSDGLIFLPHLTGERSPYWDANLRGIFFGISVYHKKPHFLRAILEGIGYSLYDANLALEENTGKICEIHLTGGMTRSNLWVKILTDIFGKKIKTLKNEDSAAFGAMILGMKALNVIDNFEDAEKFFHAYKTYSPDLENHKIYMKLFTIYRKLHDDLRSDFENIAEFQKGSGENGKS